MENYREERLFLRAPHAYTWHPRHLYLAAVDSKEGMKLWEAATGQEMKQYADLRGQVLAFSPCGKYLAIGGRGRVQVFAVHPGTLQVESTPLSSCILREETVVSALAWAPDSSRLAFGGNCWGMFVWNFLGGATKHLFTQSKTGAMSRLLWSPTAELTAWLKSGVDAIQVGFMTGDICSRLYFGHRRGVQDISWSPDGKTLASCAAGHDDFTVRLRDAMSGQVWLCYQEHTTGVQSVCYSPDGCWIASADTGGEIRVWNALNGETVYVWRETGARLEHLAWSFDGKILSVGDVRHRGILLLSMESHLPQQVFVSKGDEQVAYRVPLPPVDRYIVRTWQQEERTSTEQDALFLARTLIVELGIPTIQLIDSATGEPFYHIAATYAIAKVRQDLYLLYLRYYDAWHEQSEYGGAWLGYRDVTQMMARGDQISPLSLAHELELGAAYREAKAKEPSTPPHSVHVHLQVAAVYRQAAADIASVQRSNTHPSMDSLEVSSSVPQESSPEPFYIQATCRHATSKFDWCAIRALCWSHDGKTLISSNGYEDVKQWSAKTGKQLTKIEDSRWVNALSLSPDGTLLALGVGQHVWVVPFPPAIRSSNVGVEQGTWKKCSGQVTQVMWLPDSEHFVTNVVRGPAQLWRRSGKRASKCLQGDSVLGIRTLALSPNGRFIALVIWSGANSSYEPSTDRIEVREIATGQVVSCYRGHARGIADVAWSADSDWIVSVASSYDDSTAHVWHAFTGKQHLVYAAHTHGLSCIALSPDGRYALTGGHEPQARMWRIATGETVQVFNGMSNFVTCASFSPDGEYVAVGDFSACVSVLRRSQ